MIVTIREMNIKCNKKELEVYERGQVLLVVVLIITVVLTVSLSLFTRSIVNVKLTTEEDQSQKALSAAEAGIEQTIIANQEIPNGTFSNNTSFSTSKRQLSGTEFLLNNGKLVFKDEGADIWLSEYSSNTSQLYTNPWGGTLTLFWGSSTDTCSPVEGTSSGGGNSMAAIELIVFTGTRNNPSSARYAYDPCDVRRNSNNFSAPQLGGTAAGKSFAYNVTISIPAGTGLIARVIPLYANSYLGIQSSPALPPQGTVIESTGTAGEVKRKVSVLQEHPLLPAEVFNYTLFLPR